MIEFYFSVVFVLMLINIFETYKMIKDDVEHIDYIETEFWSGMWTSLFWIVFVVRYFYKRYV